MVNIVLHCSDSRYGNAALIAKWHVLPKYKVIQIGKVYQGNGWSGIGYHYVILNGWLNKYAYNKRWDGHIETGRILDDDHVLEKNERGAHVAGFNKYSIGVCLIGDSGNFTDKQLNSTLEILYILENQFIDIKIVQHSDLNPDKSYCAGLDMDKLKKNYEIYKMMMEVENG
jgi:hypothetical protein